MKKIVLMLMILVTASTAFAATNGATSVIEISISELPETIKEFIKLRDKIAITPEGGAVVFTIAMIIYSEDKKLGLKCLTAILANDGTMLMKDKKGYKGYSPAAFNMYLIKRVDNKPFIPQSYVNGSVPANGYQLPSFPYKFELSRNKYSKVDEITIKVYIACGGAASDRPVKLTRNNKGIWKVKEFSSFVLDIQASTLLDNDEL